VVVVIDLKTTKQIMMNAKMMISRRAFKPVAFATLIAGLVTISNPIAAQDSLAVSPLKVPSDSATVSKPKPKEAFSKDCLCIDDSLFTDVQFSVVPGISTSCYAKNKNAVYDFSFNLIMGKVYGVKYMELGGVVNIDEANVSYLQGAGVGNIVGGKVTGAQWGGVFNMTGDVTGAQHAGVVNHVKGDFLGVQHAGVVNIVTRSFVGAQFGGVMNFADSVRGFQDAGVINQAGYVKGMQLSGVVNRAANVKGVQMTGVVNLANDIKGVQVAGVVNRARAVNGFQLALVNIADTVDGACLGLVNVVKHGYHRWEVAGDEVFHSNVAYRSGVPMLHTILTTGVMTEKIDGPTWTFGAGLGMSFGRQNKTMLDIDLTTNQVVERDRFKEDHLLHKVYVGIDQPLSRKFSLAFGVTYNFFFYQEGESNRISEIMPKSLYKENIHGNTMMDSWIGGKVALRFR